MGNRRQRNKRKTGEGRSSFPGVTLLLVILWTTLGLMLFPAAGGFATKFAGGEGLHPVAVFLRLEYQEALLVLLAGLAVPVLTLLGWLLLSGMGRLLARRRAKPRGGEEPEGPPTPDLDEQTAWRRRSAKTMNRAEAAALRCIGRRRRTLVFVGAGLQLVLAAMLVTAGGYFRVLFTHREDLRRMGAGELAEYAGGFVFCSGQLNREDLTYTFLAGEQRLRCPYTNYNNRPLPDGGVVVRYLPDTKTLVDIRWGGELLTGTSTSPAELEALLARPEGEAPEGYWLYDGVIPVRRCTEIYGYDSLTPEGQKAFDLFYGEYFSRDVTAGLEGTHGFTLPESISEQEYARVQKLYKASTAYNCYAGLRYDTDSRGDILRVYAGGIHYGGGSENRFNSDYKAVADQVVAAMPTGLTDAEKCLYLSRYLVENVRPEASTPGRADVTASNVITILPSERQNSTGYGALVNGYADSVGYMQAFHLLADRAGLVSIPVSGLAVGAPHAWNMVLLDGGW